MSSLQILYLLYFSVLQFFSVANKQSHVRVRQLSGKEITKMPKQKKFGNQKKANCDTKNGIYNILYIYVHHGIFLICSAIQILVIWQVKICLITNVLSSYSRVENTRVTLLFLFGSFSILHALLLNFINMVLIFKKTT